MSVEQLRAEGQIDGPELPGRLEGHGSMSWDFLTEHVANIPAGVSFRAYAERYQPIRRRWLHGDRNMIKTYESPLAEMTGHA